MGKIITNRYMPKKNHEVVPIGNIGKEPLVLPNYSGVKRSLNEGPQDFNVKREMIVYDDIRVYFGTDKDGYIKANNTGMTIYTEDEMLINSLANLDIMSTDGTITLTSLNMILATRDCTFDGSILLKNVITLEAGDSTPQIKYSNIFRGPASGRGYSITTFDSPEQGQIIYIRLQGCPITFVDQSSGSGKNIYMSGSVNWTFTANQTVTFLYDNGNWYELSRSLN
jgi:hypothetical protein